MALPLGAWRFLSENWLARRDFWWLAVVGRLKPAGRWRGLDALRAISPGMFEATIPTGYGATMPTTSSCFSKLSAFPVANGFSALSKNYAGFLALASGDRRTGAPDRLRQPRQLDACPGERSEQEIAVRLALAPRAAASSGSWVADGKLRCSAALALLWGPPALSAEPISSRFSKRRRPVARRSES